MYGYRKFFIELTFELSIELRENIWKESQSLEKKSITTFSPGVNSLQYKSVMLLPRPKESFLQASQTSHWA